MRPGNIPTRAFYAILIGTAVWWTGCDNNTVEEIPVVLPAEAFSLRTELFATVPPGAGEHFAAAVERMEPVENGFREYLDLPVAISVAAEQSTPTRNGDDYVWTASTDYKGNSTDFELTGTPVTGDVVDWILNVTYQDENTSYEDFEMVSARSLTSGALGEWTQYADLEGIRTLIFRGQYGVVGFDRFVGVSADDSLDLEIAGDSIEYNESSSNIRELLWFAGDRENAFFVQWNPGTKAGFLVATDYNDSAQSCWDTSLANVGCE